MPNFFDYRFEENYTKITSPLIVFGGDNDFANKETIAMQNKLLKLTQSSAVLVIVNE